ncbi:MAG: hypothetical protein ABEJ31_04030 [Haloarculaceae archaeon]
MTLEKPSRRRLLRTGAAATSLAALGSIAGCTDVVDSVMGGDGKVKQVPSDAEAAGTIDVAAVREDDGTRQVVDAYLEVRAQSDWYSGPEDFQGLLDQFEEDTGLDPAKLSTATPFYAYSDKEYGVTSDEFYGSLFAAEWAEDDLIDAAEEGGTDYSDSDYGGKTVYEPDNDYSVWYGVFADGEYVYGTEDAVKAAIDVRNGDGDSLDEDLRKAYEQTRSAPVRFVSTVPANKVPDTIGRNDQVQTGVLADVDHAAGSIYRDGDTRGFALTLAADDESAADDVAAMIDGLVTFTKRQTERDALASALDAVEVAQDGAKVDVTAELSVDQLVELAKSSLSGSSSGSSSSRHVSEAPQAMFSFAYDGGADTLTVMHEGGDSIKAAALSLHGTGFESVRGVDMTASGQWAGSTSGTIGGEPAVVAGDSVTLGVAADYRMYVVYDAPDGSTSTTLGMATGPDA